MVFSHRMAALAAVVAIPLGIAATSYALTDDPQPPKVPPKVRLESGSPSAEPTIPRPTPSDETVSPPPVSEKSSGDDNDDDGSDGRHDDSDDSTDDDGPGDDG
ncbi:small secreted hydrophilic protein [Streptomyces sp. WAC 01529]|uniref:small secreted hydrophilic protein n=1 Tax=Streptomyces sp. WAC 01529 TaxID=2203205 RepID=UPI000F70C402|nr:small secreted hydrophilic protein [Streptomyces sp. WAC 01529]AZM52814.1 small secreted hydrophilic protein [Streptomyces sp. WAC 01529]